MSRGAHTFKQGDVTKAIKGKVNAGLAVKSVQKAHAGSAARPPSYMSRKELAWELSCCESTVDELVRRGRIPKPVNLTSGCVRWWWPGVEAALDGGGSAANTDAYAEGADHAV